MRNRLHALSPYFAMFPEAFAEGHISRHTEAGDLVLDPFSGRGTTLFQALLMERDAAALDVNPVAYCLSAAKADPPELTGVLTAIAELEREYDFIDRAQIREERLELPAFFRRGYHRDTLDQVLFLRSRLRWRDAPMDCFIAALSLGILHGEMGRSSRYLSNQMPRTISTKPNYSLGYWRSHNLWPKRRDVFRRLCEEARFRLESRVAQREGVVALGDARDAARLLSGFTGRARLVVTSPPYFDVTNFREDQWLRLWFLAVSTAGDKPADGADDRHRSPSKYWTFLRESWAGVAPLLADDATMVVRIGARGMADEEIAEGLRSSLALEGYATLLEDGPRISKMQRRQTSAFRPGAGGLRHELDFIFHVQRMSASN